MIRDLCPPYSFDEFSRFTAHHNKIMQKSKKNEKTLILKFKHNVYLLVYPRLSDYRYSIVYQSTT
jgi:hypothetical protein